MCRVIPSDCCSLELITIMTLDGGCAGLYLQTVVVLN